MESVSATVADITTFPENDTNTVWGPCGEGTPTLFVSTKETMAASPGGRAAPVRKFKIREPVPCVHCPVFWNTVAPDP